MTAGLFADRHQMAWGVDMPLHNYFAVLTFRRVTTWKLKMMAVLCVSTPCIDEILRHVRGTCCLYLQGD
jgi:hypothetical protein